MPVARDCRLRLIDRQRLSVVAVAAILTALPMNAQTESGPDSAPSPSLGEARVCEGVYSIDQAQGGQKIFAAQCAQCHGANFRGGFGVASLAGPAFTVLWGDKTLLSLFDRMKSTMPLNSPGALSDQRYVAVLARILQVNGFPASDVAELPLQRDGLERLTLPKECPEK